MNDDDENAGGAGLTPQELRFCEAYANPESESFGNASKSAAAAKYARPSNAGWKLRRRGRIRTKLAEYHEGVSVALGQVMTNLEHLRRLAVEKGDLQAAVRAVELQGKRLGGFIDGNVILVSEQMRVYSEAEVAEAQHLARLRLEAGNVGELEGETAVLKLLQIETDRARDRSEDNPNGTAPAEPVLSTSPASDPHIPEPVDQEGSDE